MKPALITIAILFSLPMICLAIRALCEHWRANRKPRNQDRRAEHRTRREIMRKIIERGSVK